jgi:hypothetical protein
MVSSPSYLEAGYVTPSGEDIFPTTAPHLDVRIKSGDKYIDPGSLRSLLTRLKVGKERKPLWQQQGEEWKPGFAITSGFGKRKPPTAGASSWHPAHDYAVAGGTPLFWEGPGTFVPGKGYGTIKTTDAQGNPYEIKLLHTKGGKSSSVAGQPTQPAQGPAQTTAGRLPDTYIFIGGQGQRKENPTDFLNSYISQSLSGGVPEIKSMIDPASMLAQAFSQTPNYLS